MLVGFMRNRTHNRSARWTSEARRRKAEQMRRYWKRKKENEMNKSDKAKLAKILKVLNAFADKLEEQDKGGHLINMAISTLDEYYSNNKGE